MFSDYDFLDSVSLFNFGFLLLGLVKKYFHLKKKWGNVFHCYLSCNCSRFFDSVNITSKCGVELVFWASNVIMLPKLHLFTVISICFRIHMYIYIEREIMQSPLDGKTNV